MAATCARGYVQNTHGVAWTHSVACAPVLNAGVGRPRHCEAMTAEWAGSPLPLLHHLHLIIARLPFARLVSRWLPK